MVSALSLPCIPLSRNEHLNVMSGRHRTTFDPQTARDRIGSPSVFCLWAGGCYLLHAAHTCFLFFVLLSLVSRCLQSTELKIMAKSCHLSCVGYWLSWGKTGVCAADFGTSLVTFSSREKPGCVNLDASRPLLHQYEPCWLFHPSLALATRHLEKMFLYLGFSQHQRAILSLPPQLLLAFLALSLHMPCFLFFSKLILLM